MKKSFAMIGSLFVLSALLVACNTDTAEPTNTAATTSQQPENTQSDVKPEETNQPEEQATKQTNNEQTKSEQSETILTYVTNGTSFTEDVITSTNEELNYTISHFKTYSLVAEEPGVDHLFYNADDAFSMQIEVTTTDDATFDAIKATTVEMMNAIGPEGNYTELDLTTQKAQHTDIKNIVGYETLIDVEKVYMISFERANKLITLTIYDTPEADLFDAFLQMGLTIQ